MSKIKNYCEDYGKLLKASAEFEKEHWLGNIIVSVATFVIMLGVGLTPNAIESIKEKRELKKIKKKAEEQKGEGEEET